MTALERRRTMRGVALAAASVFLVTGAALAQEPEAAPAAPAIITNAQVALGGAGRTGFSEDPGPERPPAIVWSQPVAKNAVTEPVAVTLEGRRVLLVGSGEQMLALDARSGEPLWQNDLGMLVGAPAVIAGDRIFVHGMDGLLRIVNPKDGTTFKDVENDYTLESPGLVFDGTYVYEETSHAGGSSKSLLHWLDLGTRFDRARASYPDDLGRAPATDGQVVVVAGISNTRAFAAADASPAWTYSHPAAARTYGAIVQDGRVFLARGSYGPGTVEALDLKTGQRLWSVTTEARLAASPTLAGDEIIVPLMNATLARLAVADGAARTPIKTQGRVDQRVVATARRLFFCTGKTFGSIDRATGKVEWTLEVDGSVSVMSVDGGMLYVGRTDGALVAVESPPEPAPAPKP